jgi:hypothetical protein
MSYLRKGLLTGEVWRQHVSLHSLAVGRRPVSFLIVIFIGAAIEIGWPFMFCGSGVLQEFICQKWTVALE